MQYHVATVKEYLEQIPEERKPVMKKLRDVINKNIPEGFDERVSYGMIGWVVPHSKYSAGYHCNPADPLPFLNIASQKNFIAVYHMVVYSDKKMYDWFVSEYNALNIGKLDMGKSCIRFKKPEKIPFDLIGELAAKITPDEWIKRYEAMKPVK